MLLSSEFCRLQAKTHHDRAATATLANVREIAAKAALVWDSECVLALKREQRHLAAAQGAAAPSEDDMSGPDPDEYIPRVRADAVPAHALAENAVPDEDRQG